MTIDKSLKVSYNILVPINNTRVTEERICKDKPYINISRCMKGIVVPKNLTSDEELNYQKTLDVAAMQIGQDFDIVSY